MMAGMEVDSPPEQEAATSLRYCIVQRLVQLGVPLDQFSQTPSFLLNFINNNKSLIPDLVLSILPTDEDIFEIQRKLKKEPWRGNNRHDRFSGLYVESLLWIQWMMFGQDPHDCLENMAQKASGQRAVCGAVWGHKDLAYRCRTCENDPTCAICVTCFQNGSHKDHDYSIMYTGGGCCDCGDETAWKREGFCSKHKGVDQIQPLSGELVSSVGPVLDILLASWRDKVVFAEQQSRARSSSSSSEVKEVANELSFAIVNMLLDFCNCSESLLSFIAKRIYECTGLLDLLIRAERFLDKEVVKKLHELLLKLLGEPLFKYEFAKAFIDYYPVTMKEIIKGCNDLMLEEYPLLSTFSVQIFTVPTLTLRLVREMDLLGVLLRCLMDIFLSCVGKDGGRLQVNKWASINETAIPLIEDTRYVMSHDDVSIYIAEERPDISRSWLRLLSFVQGMDPQIRTRRTHTEEDSDSLHELFVLGHVLGNIHTILVGGTISVTKSKELKVSRGDCSSVPASATWLIFECLKAIESWLGSGYVSVDASSSSSSNIFNWRKKSLRTETSSSRVFRGTLPSEGVGSPSVSGEREEVLGRDNDLMDASDLSDVGKFLDGRHVRVDSTRDLETLKLLNLVDWPDIGFDVSSQEISFHIPLHRLLSLLLRKTMQTLYGENGSLDKICRISSLVSSGHHEFFGQLLKGAHPCGFSSYIMESPLRLRVFCAQVRAGMWRKNSDSAILCCECYRSVHWLDIGLEPDLFLLQCCAALAPPELFVKRIQERFGLTDYTSLNLANHNRHEPILAQEMLTLIIQIVSERRFCGLSTIENLRRELVYNLAIGDATRSQLVKALPRDLSKSVQLQSVLDTLADYSNPSGMKQGKYSLRKAFWKELDLYHPRWNSRDLQIAEERYLRFCKVSPLNAQLPLWKPIFDPMHGISRIATSKSVLQFIRAVIFYAVFTETASVSRAPDSVLIKALHLLSLGLDICEGQLHHVSDDCFPLLAYVNEEFDAGVADEVLWKNQSLLSLLVSLMRKQKENNGYNYNETKQCNIYSLIENLLKRFAQLSLSCMDNLKRLAPELICHMPHPLNNMEVNTSTLTSGIEDLRAKARERQAAVMEKMRAEQSKFIASLKSEVNDEMDITSSDHDVSMSEVDHASEESSPVCSLCRGSNLKSPLCYLILLQKSRLTSFVDRGPVSWNNADQSNKEICPSGKEGINESEIQVQLVQTQRVDLDVGYCTETEVDAFQGIAGEFLSESRKDQPLIASYGGTLSSPLMLEMFENDVYESITREISSDALNGEVKCSTSQVPVGSEISKSGESCTLGGAVASLSAKSSYSTIPTARFSEVGPRDFDGIHLSSCGHAVHQDCHKRYLTSLKQRNLRRLGFEGGLIVNPDLGEMLCPVCRRLSNSIIPAFPPGASNKARNLESTNVSLNSFFANNDNLQLPLALSLLQCTAKIVGVNRFMKEFLERQIVNTERALELVLHKLNNMYGYHGFNKLTASGKKIQSLILWNTFIYSLVSTEIVSRGKMKTCSVSSLSLEALYSELHSSNGFILSLLLGIAQAARISSHQDVLTRFRGIQLFAGSICYGTLGRSSLSDKRKDTFLYILERADKGEPCFVFYKRAAGPILAYDAFSSLMWVLFCLPFPFISLSESFMALVHLFYCVCVLQGLITCYSRPDFDVSYFRDFVINGRCKMMGESEFVRKYFVSNYIDLACHPKDMIRRFTLPYLRRCALLQKMLRSSTSTPLFNESSSTWGSTPTKGSAVENHNTVELNAVSELEEMFEIQSLDLVLKNEVMHSLALKWCDHFCGEFRVRNYGFVLYSNPAVPFKLMQLPRLYQDLLQRYVKLQCSGCNSIPDEPALCLLCGKLCSPNWKTCCRESRCLDHSKVCGAGIGVFLLVRITTVLLQRSSRMAAWPSPYLDAFGEEDHEIKRGRPLYLSEERYAALTYLVASHALDQTSEVLRVTTLSFDDSE